MPDPYRKIQVGDRWPFSVTAYNGMVDAARATRERQFDGGGDGPSQTRQAGIVRVKNESGSDLARCSVLGLNGPIFTPTDSEDAFLREVTFRGVVPTTAHKGKFCILLEPAPIDRVVRAYLSGVCPVRVDIADSADTHATVEAGETGHLNSTSGGGSAQILWLESDDGYGYDTGEQWAVVRLGPAVDGAFLCTSGGSDILARSGTTVHSGDVSPLVRTSSTIGDDPDLTSFTAWNLVNKKIAASSYVFVVWGSGDWWIVAVGDCVNLS